MPRAPTPWPGVRCRVLGASSSPRRVRSGTRARCCRRRSRTAWTGASLPRVRLPARWHAEVRNKMTHSFIALGFNIDHIATLRQARRARSPDPVHAALAAEIAGADSITLHLREDRRHIQVQDVRALKELLKTRMNLEMAVTDEMLDIARAVRPADVCLVPERRQEVTTEGGLDAAGQVQRLKEATAILVAQSIRVALFVDPDARQVEAAVQIGAPVIELHTGAYAESAGSRQAAELARLQVAARPGAG